MQRAEDKRTSGQPGIIASERLTKRFFMGLPEGVYVVSGYFDSEFRPLFEQYAAKAGPTREMQWEEVKKAQVDQHVCRVFRTQGDSAAFHSCIISTGRQPGMVAAERLTKRFFMGLPEGVYAASGLCNRECRPLFEQHVAKAGPARERQWEEVKKAQVDQHVCHVFRTQGDSAAFRSRASLGGLQASDVLGTVPSTAQMHTARAPTVLETGGLPR
jgi:hypothetical protein